MSIVAISETAGSLGNEIGRRLAERLNYRFADREIIAKTAERFGENVSDLRHAAEEKPTLWERWSDTQSRYKAYIEAIILEMATGDDVVLAGLASTVVLRPVAHALRVRTNAPERVRAGRLEQEQGFTREAALGYVRESDHERAARVKFLYQVNVDDPLLYDVVLNTERLMADEGARLVQEALRERRFQTSEASQCELVDLGIAAGAKAAFMANPAIDPRRVFVTASRGYVCLSGSVDAEKERKLVQSIVEQMPGVTGVLNEIIAIPRSRSGGRLSLRS
jgi:cytidylate kinase